jgi:hypothetical protein
VLLLTWVVTLQVEFFQHASFGQVDLEQARLACYGAVCNVTKRSVYFQFSVGAQGGVVVHSNGGGNGNRWGDGGEDIHVALRNVRKICAMHPYLFAQGMVIQIAGASTGVEGSNEITGIDTEDINLWDSRGYSSPDILLSVAHDIIKVTSDAGVTIIRGDVLAHLFGCNGLDLFGTIGGEDGDTIFTEHPHVGFAATDWACVCACTDFMVSGPGNCKISSKQ